MVGYRIKSVSALAVLSLLVSIVAAPVSGAEPNGRNFERVPFAGIDPQILPASIDDARTVTVMLELNGLPVARQQGAARRQGRELSDAQRAAARGTLKAKQDQLRPRIEATGGQVLAQLQDAYNGVKVRVARSKIPALAALPGVVAVHGVTGSNRPTPRACRTSTAMSRGAAA